MSIRIASTRHRVLRYGAALLCLGLVTVYVASQRWSFFIQTRPVAAEIMGGVVEVRRGGVPSWSVTRHNWPWRHKYGWSAGGANWEIRLPLAVAVVPVMVLTALLWAGWPRPHLRPGPARRVAGTA